MVWARSPTRVMLRGQRQFAAAAEVGRDHLFGFRDDLKNRPAHPLKRAALRLLDISQYASTSSVDTIFRPLVLLSTGFMTAPLGAVSL